MTLQLEVIAFNIESCIAIEQTKAHRVELCMNPAEGGTTPSAGFIRAAREKLSKELFPIIRPRGGDFLYTDNDFQVMKSDIKLAKELSCDGVVIGILMEDGRVDLDRTRKLVDLAYPLDVTFHRAFDRVPDPLEALETIIDSGCTRILTSGLHRTASEGKELLKTLVEQSDGRIAIMPGSGVRQGNIADLAAYTGAVEFHTSARRIKAGNMLVANPVLQEAEGYLVADEAEIRACLDELARIADAPF